MQDIQDAAQHALEITEVKRDLARKTVGRDNLYVFFETMYDAASAEAAQPVVKKWTGRLGGVETFAANHTFTSRAPGRKRTREPVSQTPTRTSTTRASPSRRARIRPMR